MRPFRWLLNVKLLPFFTGIMIVLAGCFPESDRDEFIVKEYSAPVIVDSITVACVLTRFNKWDSGPGLGARLGGTENFTQFILVVDISDSAVDTICRLPRIMNRSYHQILEYFPPFLFICNVVEEDGTSSVWRYSFTSKTIDKMHVQTLVRPAHAADTVYDTYGALYRLSSGERLYTLPFLADLLYCNAVQNEMILRTYDRLTGRSSDFLYNYTEFQGTIDTIRMDDSLSYYKSTNKSQSLLFRRKMNPDTVFIIAADSLDAALSHRSPLPISSAFDLQGKNFDISLEDHLLAIDFYDGLLIRDFYDEVKLTLNNEIIALPD